MKKNENNGGAEGFWKERKRNWAVGIREERAG